MSDINYTGGIMCEAARCKAISETRASSENSLWLGASVEQGGKSSSETILLVGASVDQHCVQLFPSPVRW
jgi:hypothetical protein